MSLTPSPVTSPIDGAPYTALLVPWRVLISFSQRSDPSLLKMSRAPRAPATSREPVPTTTSFFPSPSTSPMAGVESMAAVAWAGQCPGSGAPLAS